MSESPERLFTMAIQLQSGVGSDGLPTVASQRDGQGDQQALIPLISDMAALSAEFDGEQIGEQRLIKYGVLTLQAGDAEKLLVERALGLPDMVRHKQVIFALDNSGSMEGPKLKVALTTLKNLLRFLRVQAIKTKEIDGHTISGISVVYHVTVLTFSSRVSTIIHQQSLAEYEDTAFDAMLESTIGRIFASGGTNIEAAVREMMKVACKKEMGDVVDEEAVAASRHGVVDAPILILLTDGDITIGSSSYEFIANLLTTPSASSPRPMFFVLAYGNDCDHEQLRLLASRNQNGGQMYSVLDTENTLGSALASIVDSICYTVLQDVEVVVKWKDEGAVRLAGAKVGIYNPEDNAFGESVELACLTSGSRRSFVLRMVLPCTYQDGPDQDLLENLDISIRGRNHLAADIAPHWLIQGVSGINGDAGLMGCETKGVFLDEIRHLYHQQLVYDVHTFNQRRLQNDEDDVQSSFAMRQPVDLADGWGRRVATAAAGARQMHHNQFREEHKAMSHRLLVWYRQLKTMMAMEKLALRAEMDGGAVDLSSLPEVRQRFYDEMKTDVSMLVRTLGGSRATRYSEILSERQKSASTFATAAVQKSDISDTFDSLVRSVTSTSETNRGGILRRRERSQNSLLEPVQKRICWDQTEPMRRSPAMVGLSNRDDAGGEGEGGEQERGGGGGEQDRGGGGGGEEEEEEEDSGEREDEFADFRDMMDELMEISREDALSTSFGGMASGAAVGSQPMPPSPLQMQRSVSSHTTPRQQSLALSMSMGV